jgi:hypothetical protein
VSEPTVSPATGEVAALRARLVATHAELIEWMVRDGIEGGTLALLAGIGATLKALAAIPADIAPAARAIVSDGGGKIWLTLYGEAGAIATVTLASCRAVALAGELIAAALPRLRTP